jgi:hypothetical protein
VGDEPGKAVVRGDEHVIVMGIMKFLLIAFSELLAIGQGCAESADDVGVVLWLGRFEVGHELCFGLRVDGVNFLELVEHLSEGLLVDDGPFAGSFPDSGSAELVVWAVVGFDDRVFLPRAGKDGRRERRSAARGERSRKREGCHR